MQTPGIKGALLLLKLEVSALVREEFDYRQPLFLMLLLQ
jgi:hypothetical protein